MHKLNVIVFGSKNLNTSLEELKDYFNFKLTTSNDNFSPDLIKKFDIILFDQDYIKKIPSEKQLMNIDKIKILIISNNQKQNKIFKEILPLPTTIDEINNIVEKSVVKKNFNKNSAINVKSYILDKNEKKLIKSNIFILLTEKEIHLIDLFLINRKPLSKAIILKEVWKYSSSADTHTVETHIYRLRKKIKSVFNDENFILNKDNGYSL